MKSFKYILIALICALFTACQDGDWDEPSFKEPPFGNNSITEDNVIPIRELISRYPNVFASTDQNVQITEDIKIRGRVTGNDLGGNLYKQFSLQDESAAIIVAVNQNGLNGYLAEGQEIIVALKDLYIGGYRKQPEIGAPYNVNSIGRMSKDVWLQHFKIIGGMDNIKPDAIQPVDFETIKGDYDNNCGKLVILKNVHFKDANGSRTLVDGTTSGGNYVNQQLKEYGTNVVVRTSTYADFAKMVMPTSGVNLTGIATRYNNTWQILIRKTSDIQVVN